MGLYFANNNTLINVKFCIENLLSSFIFSIFIIGKFYSSFNINCMAYVYHY